MKTNPAKSIVICAFLAILILLCLTNKCQKTEKVANVGSDTLRIYIDKWHDSVRVKTEIRTKVITKYKEVRYDSLVPCETKLYYCDTLVLADSALIQAYKEQVFLDSLFMESQSKKIQDTCRYFKKQIRKHKIQKWLIILGAVGSHAVIK